MIDLDFWNAARLVNLVLAIVCVTGMLLRRKWWNGQTPEIRLLLLALGALVLATAYANFELLLRGGLPGSPRILLFTPPLAWIAYAQIRTIKKEAP